MTPPLILASGSAIRAQLLREAGLTFDVQTSKVDEDIIKDEALANGVSPKAIALKLAQAKALDVSRLRSGIVIGADSIVQLEGELISKSPNLEAAAAQMRAFSGRIHHLHSAVAVASGTEILWSTVQTAQLSVRRLSDAFIADYIKRAGEAILSSVGGYQLEGLGIQIFDQIEGDYFTILGLPLLPLLQQLRHLEVLPA
jgi:septum formation protein